MTCALFGCSLDFPFPVWDFGASEVVEGFSVFKSSESLSSLRERNALEAVPAEQKKEAEKQIEVRLGHLLYILPEKSGIFL